MILPPCLDQDHGINSTCTIDDGYAIVSAKRVLDSSYNDETLWRLDIEGSFDENIGQCGLRCNLDGTFSDAEYEAHVLTLREETVQAVFLMLNNDIAAARRAQQKSAMLTIGAAAGGAVVLIAIIVIVVLLRRRQPSEKPASKDDGSRQVVAFENPMYESPEPDFSNALYESPEADDEGLYDEPAFNGAKENPLYQSTDNLFDGEEEGDMEDGGGYLDVAPEDDDDE
jgi:hypothetical protein